MSRLKRFDSIIVLLVAFTYYFALSSRIFTWIFASGDSGDWLYGSIWWTNVQPFGSPLYVFMGHLINLFSNDLPYHMTLFLSVIPASITVCMVYIIAKKLTNPQLAIVSSLVMLGATIPLTQATILEEYAFASMFMTLAVWFYINDKKKLTILMLALGSAIHVIVAIISIVWLCLHIKQLKEWYKTFWIYVVVGILPYIYVPILMYLPDTPRMLAGSLSWQSFNNYLGSSSTIGTISWFEFLYRIKESIGIFVVSLGFALIPLFVGIRRPFPKYIWLMIATIFFSLWLYMTDLDPSTWTFMNFCFPMIAVLVAVGLQNMKPLHTKLVASCAIVLILVNSIGMNANLLSQQAPIATNFEKAVFELPDGAGIITSSGGEYGLGVMYCMAKGKDVFPVFYTGQNTTREEYGVDARYQSYRKWLEDKYNIYGYNTVHMVQYMLDNNRPIYLLLPMVTPFWNMVFNAEYSVTMPSNTFESKEIIFARITSINWNNLAENQK